METVGWLSIVPPIIAIALAIKTREVYISLGLFVWIGWTIMNSMNPITGLIQSVDVFLGAVTDPGNAKTLLFSLLIGGIITLTQASGGMEGFIEWVDRLGLGKSRVSVRLVAVMTSMVLFLESNFGLLVSGAVARPLFDRAKISREKLAYIIDTTSAPKQLLIPINAWGAYIVSLLLAEGVADANGLLLSALTLNFYAILAILLVFFVAVTDWNIGPMREADRRVLGGKLLRDGAKPMMSTDVSALEAKEGVPKRAINMVAPVVAMVASVPLVMWLTREPDGGLLSGSGVDGVLWGVIVGLFLAALLYQVQGIMSVKEATAYTIKGIQGLVPVVIVLALAFAISATQRALGTGVFLAQVAEASVNPGFIPAIIFLIGCVTAFSTGTSWGTFAIMIPIVIPMAALLDLHVGLTLAAALGGGIFGDHCSPISDSTIVASLASASDHIDHVRTQLPYALLAASGAFTLYLVMGFIL
ncbi:MAG: Na+/H+ antiporter NhaC family protein [Gemmatimonadota bacterium]|nr:MAG: Na+/H+ antiporter NhaC family protein [Gemmatimonadota bacterium]